MNVLTNNLSDFAVLDDAVRKFESISGAFPSRDKKCNGMGLGSWADKVDWLLG